MTWGAIPLVSFFVLILFVFLCSRHPRFLDSYHSPLFLHMHRPSLSASFHLMFWPCPPGPFLMNQSLNLSFTLSVHLSFDYFLSLPSVAFVDLTCSVPPLSLLLTHCSATNQFYCFSLNLSDKMPHIKQFIIMTGCIRTVPPISVYLSISLAYIASILSRLLFVVTCH